MNRPAGRPPAPRALLFDWDNTLIDSWDLIRAAMNETLLAFDMEPWSPEETRRRVAKSARDAFPALFGDRWREATDIFYGAFEAMHLARLRPLPGAGELLHALEKTGLWLAVVSNKRGDLLRAEVEALGWARYFGRLVGAGDAGEDKPAVATVDLAIDGSGLARDRTVWLIGDAPIDIECARNAGVTAVLVGESRPDPDNQAALAPDLQIPGIGLLAGLVQRFD